MTVTSPSFRAKTTVGRGLGTETSSASGAGLGIDSGAWKHFAFTGELRYLDTNLDFQGSQSTSVNPVVGRLGVAFRF